MLQDKSLRQNACDDSAQYPALHSCLTPRPQFSIEKFGEVHFDSAKALAFLEQRFAALPGRFARTDSIANGMQSEVFASLEAFVPFDVATVEQAGRARSVIEAWCRRNRACPEAKKEAVGIERAMNYMFSHFLDVQAAAAGNSAVKIQVINLLGVIAAQTYRLDSLLHLEEDPAVDVRHALIVALGMVAWDVGTLNRETRFLSPAEAGLQAGIIAALARIGREEVDYGNALAVVQTLSLLGAPAVPGILNVMQTQETTAAIEGSMSLNRAFQNFYRHAFDVTGRLRRQGKAIIDFALERAFSADFDYPVRNSAICAALQAAADKSGMVDDVRLVEAVRRIRRSPRDSIIFRTALAPYVFSEER